MSNIEKAFLVTIIVLLSQVTRNINIIVYVAVLLLSYAYLYILYVFQMKSIRNRMSKLNFNLFKLLFLFSIIWIPFISLLHIEMDEYFIALGRYLVTLPFILFCFMYKGYSKEFIKNVLKVLVIFMVLASLSIPFQMLFGEISFLADSSHREGLIRYSSLAGSLTALGTLGGFSLAILLFIGDFLFSKRKKMSFIIIIIMGMLMSLQKAAIANILLCLVAYILMNSNISYFKKIFATVGISIIGISFYFLFNESVFALYIGSLFRYTFTDSSLDVGTDFFNRLWELPSIVVGFHDISILNILFGIGFPALSGIVGLPNYPMAHNNYFDLLFSGGIIHFLSFMALISQIPLKVFYKKVNRLEINALDKTYLIITLMILTNMTIGASSFYQPISAVFIFFIIFSFKKASKEFME